MVDCNIILLFKMNKLTDAEELEAILATQDLLRFDGEVNFDDYLQDKESDNRYLSMALSYCTLNFKSTLKV